MFVRWLLVSFENLFHWWNGRYNERGGRRWRGGLFHEIVNLCIGTVVPICCLSWGNYRHLISREIRVWKETRCWMREFRWSGGKNTENAVNTFRILLALHEYVLENYSYIRVKLELISIGCVSCCICHIERKKWKKKLWGSSVRMNYYSFTLSTKWSWEKIIFLSTREVKNYFLHKLF